MPYIVISDKLLAVEGNEVWVWDGEEEKWLPYRIKRAGSEDTNAKSTV